MNNVIRVLHISYGMDRGGAETLIMNIYRNIDRNKVQFDFLLHSPIKTTYEDEILSLGGRIHHIPRFLGFNKIAYDKALKKFLIEHEEYQIIHDHLMDSVTETFKIAKELGRTTIAHSHTVQEYNSLSSIIRFFFRKNIYKYADYCFACSQEAGIWMYRGKKKFTVINNAIDTSKYAFNENTRESVRKNLKISSSDFVVGTVGRLAKEKNQKRLIKIFSQLTKQKEKSKLIIVGDGALRKELEKECKTLNIENEVLFLGSRDDIPSLLCAFDLFLFTSFSEGLGISIIEAEASGLPIVMPTSMPKEVDIIKSLITRANLDSSNKKWVSKILSSHPINRDNQYKKIACAGYDIKAVSKELEDFYVSIIPN